MGSSRLPGKVLTDVHGRPALGRLVDRLRACRRVDDIVLATSTSSKDDALAEWAATERLACYRGSEDDVLNRVVGAHRMMESDLVVEVTGDCPLLDPDVIDMGVATWIANDADIVSNTWNLSYPQGVDVQVFRCSDLEEVEATITDPAVREHVSLYFYEHPQLYRILHLQAPPRWHAPEQRFQLDYPEDLAFIRAVYAELLPQFGPLFGVGEVLTLLARRPDIAGLNASCVEKSVR